MPTTVKAKQERVNGNHGLHSSFQATLDTIAEGAPSQKQLVVLTGTLQVLKSRACKTGKFSGEAGETNRLALEQLIDRLAGMKPEDKQAWSQLKEPVLAAWTALRVL